MLIFCDNNKSLVKKVKEIMPADFWGEPIKVEEGDIFEIAKNNNCLIATASNPKFNMAGGLDKLIKDKFPKECAEPKAWTKSEHIYFVLSVDNKIQTNKEIIKTALINIFGNRHLDIAFTGIGTGIGGFSEDDFCEVLKEIVNANEIRFDATDVKGYKAFEENFVCRDKKYAVGEEFSEKVIKICSQGIHFCRKPIDVLGYYSDPACLAEVIGNGIAEENSDKICVQNLKVVKDVTLYRPELMNSGNSNSGNRNSGDSNSGNRNSGNRNSGNRNSGDRNSGYRNSGDWNSGDWNSGNRNSGNSNSGNRNSGDSNSGNSNSGNSNSGNSNSGNSNSGIFNTDEPKMRAFNKPAKITYSEWRNSNNYIYFNIPINIFVSKNNMTDEEKEKYPEYEICGGYLKTLNYKEAWAKWWKYNKSEEIIKKIKKLPNFDKKIFKEITGIEIK